MHRKILPSSTPSEAFQDLTPNHSFNLALEPDPKNSPQKFLWQYSDLLPFIGLQ